MSGIAFQTALSALTTAQRALQTVGHNMSNAATPGYSRQAVSLTTRMPVAGRGGSLVGSGVQAGRVDRVIDSLLEVRLRDQRSELGRQLVLRDHLIEMEGLFAEPGDSGLSASLSAFFAELSGATVDPDAPSIRTGVAQQGLLLADNLNTLRRQMEGVLQNIDGEVRTAVDAVNELTGQLDQINRELARSSQRLGPPPDLMDRQGQILKQLGDILDVDAQQNARGLVTVTSGGTLLVSPVGSVSLEMTPSGTLGEAPDVRAAGATQPLRPQAGRMAALLQIADTSVDKRIAALDRLASNLIRDVNRVHSTGIPLDGGYTSLISQNQIADVDGDGSFLDEQLSNAGLPFEIVNGRLIVNVTDESTGAVQQSEISIDENATTVGDLVTALDAIPNLTASLDPLGQLRLVADGGHRFDFSNRLPPIGDLGDTFGSAQATIVGGAGPYVLSNGSSFNVSVQGGAPQAVTFNTGQFVNITQATAGEVAAAINAQLTGATAEVVDGRVVLRDNAVGPQSSLVLTDGAGNPLSALGVNGLSDSGADHSVDVRLSGAYAGTGDQNLTFEPVGSGQVGSGTLLVNVKDAQGNVLTTLDVGSGYQPGTELDVIDGVKVSFGPGTLSETAGDRFDLDLVGDSDSADVLVGLGLATFFNGKDAGDIAVRSDLLEDGRLIAGGLSPAPGDGSNFLRMLAVQDAPSKGLGDLTIEGFYEKLITDLGVESSRAQSTAETQDLVLESLEARRDSVSGVNIDEELLKMDEYQQLYQVAARFLQTMQEVNDILVNIAG